LTGPLLNLVILYHAAENSYSISAHNPNPEEAQKLHAEWQPQLKPGFVLVAIGQQKPHKTTDGAVCRACRDTVRRLSGLVPTPTCKRRKRHDG
jgi:hypothetical protein